VRVIREGFEVFFIRTKSVLMVPWLTQDIANAFDPLGCMLSISQKFYLPKLMQKWFLEQTLETFQQVAKI